jgi:phosphotransferase system enzyme I (PtsI)
MRDPMSPYRSAPYHSGLRGRPVAPGAVTGPLVRLAAPAAPAAAAAGAGLDFAAARAAAALELEALIAAAGAGPAADVVAFQRELIDDDSLIGAVEARIGAGEPALAAWCGVLDGEIGALAQAEDEVFRSRTADLVDLRDRVAGHLAGVTASHPDLPAHAVVHADDLMPSRFLAIDWDAAGGIALGQGSAASHVAMLARARAVPMVVGLGSIGFGPGGLDDGETVTLDGDAGLLTRAAPGTPHGRRAAAAAAPDLAALGHGAAVTADGIKVETHINIVSLADLARPEAAYADGIGLVRTEFLFADRLPGEDEQTAVYRDLLAWAAGRPVTIRTLDVGGDKPLAGVTAAGEANPALGLRGIRLSLARPEIFRVQLRALARAAVHGQLEVMFPMVAVPREFDAAAAMMQAEVEALAAAGVPARRPKLGMMVEVPSAAIAVERFAAEFYSIGSNDLTQFVLACDRSSGLVGDLFDPLDPAVLDLIQRVVAHGKALGRKVALCGELAADPTGLAALIACGLRQVSVPPAALARARAAIVRHRRAGPGRYGD